MSEKTEQPTPKKLRDARKKGQVVKSKEIVSALSIVLIFGCIWIWWPYWLESCRELLLLPTAFYGIPFEEALPLVIRGVFIKTVILCMPIVLLGAFAGFAGNFFQTGALFSFQSVTPNLKKVNPVEGVKNIFSMKNLLELLKSTFKIVFLFLLIFFLLKHSIDSLLKTPSHGLPGVFRILSAIMVKVVEYTIGAFVVVALLDYFLQRKLHYRKLKMSKDEVKREYKEMEGDPMIKSKRKQLHRELINNDTIARTRKATVLVTNPTRRAIALYYDSDEEKLPMVLSMGENMLAKRMIEAAQEEGIPIMQNVPLARELFEQANVDHYIPSDLIEAVAEVLLWVQQLEQEKNN